MQVYKFMCYQSKVFFLILDKYIHLSMMNWMWVYTWLTDSRPLHLWHAETWRVGLHDCQGRERHLHRDGHSGIGKTTKNYSRICVWLCGPPCSLSCHCVPLRVVIMKYIRAIPLNVAHQSRFISWKTHFLILAGTAFCQIWLGRLPPQSYLVKCTSC